MRLVEEVQGLVETLLSLSVQCTYYYPITLLISGPQKTMEELEDDFINGYLDVPEVDNEELPPSTWKPSNDVALSEVDRNTMESAAENEPEQKKTKKLKKRVALSDVNTNTVESAAENEPKQKKCHMSLQRSTPNLMNYHHQQ